MFLRDKSASCSHGLELSPRPTTVIGITQKERKHVDFKKSFKRELEERSSTKKKVNFEDAKKLQNLEVTKKIQNQCDQKIHSDDENLRKDIDQSDQNGRTERTLSDLSNLQLSEERSVSISSLSSLSTANETIDYIDEAEDLTDRSKMKGEENEGSDQIKLAPLDLKPIDARGEVDVFADVHIQNIIKKFDKSEVKISTTPKPKVLPRLQNLKPANQIKLSENSHKLVEDDKPLENSNKTPEARFLEETSQKQSEVSQKLYRTSEVLQKQPQIIQKHLEFVQKQSEIPPNSTDLFQKPQKSLDVLQKHTEILHKLPEIPQKFLEITHKPPEVPQKPDVKKPAVPPRNIRGKLDKSHSTPAYDLTEVNENKLLEKFSEPISPIPDGIRQNKECFQKDYLIPSRESNSNKEFFHSYEPIKYELGIPIVESRNQMMDTKSTVISFEAQLETEKYDMFSEYITLTKQVVKDVPPKPPPRTCTLDNYKPRYPADSPKPVIDANKRQPIKPLNFNKQNDQNLLESPKLVAEMTHQLDNYSYVQENRTPSSVKYDQCTKFDYPKPDVVQHTYGIYDNYDVGKTKFEPKQVSTPVGKHFPDTELPSKSSQVDSSKSGSEKVSPTNSIVRAMIYSSKSKAVKKKNSLLASKYYIKLYA